jgi:ADP-dependent phosphofructokinase/glucokinase
MKMNIICAYPINLDAIYDIGSEELAGSIGGAEPKAVTKVNSLSDLFSALLYCMQTGSGAEILIEQEDLKEKIKSLFPWHYRLGGNAGIMANVLAVLGAQPILNAPALSRRLAEMLDLRVGIPSENSLKPPGEAAGMDELMHFVFQFKEGDRLSSRLGEIIAKRDNRLIVSYDPLNSRLYSNQDFDNYCLKNISCIDGALVSGFHLAPISNYREIFDGKIKDIKSWKKKNPKIFIHAEMGSFQDPEIMKYLMPRLPVDSIGMNEDELAMSGVLETGWRGTARAALKLKKNLAISRIGIHTRDYILSIISEPLNPEIEIAALVKGTCAASSMAATGSIASRPPSEVNATGLVATKEFCNDGAIRCKSGAFMRSGDSLICLVPSLVARNPKFTVGLGDTATASIFYEELMAIKGEAGCPGHIG